MERKFDCLKMKEEIQAKIYEEIKDMSSSEILAYFNKKSQTNALWQRLVNRDNLRKQNLTINT
jgi:SRSO17 transposase